MKTPKIKLNKTTGLYEPVLNEATIQAHCIAWFKQQFPRIMINSDAGGVRFGSGKEAMIRGMLQKRAGHLKGFPDLQILAQRNCCIDCESQDGVNHTPCAKEGFGGLFIEMKKDGGKVSPEQQAILDYLNANHYKAVVCHSLDEFQRVVNEYLGVRE